jgi:hypothetical protein
MSNIPEEEIRRAQERAEKRGREWLDREEKEMEQQEAFEQQLWNLMVPAEQDVTTKEYQEKVKQILEAYLRALTGAQ